MQTNSVSYVSSREPALNQRLARIQYVLALLALVPGILGLVLSVAIWPFTLAVLFGAFVPGCFLLRGYYLMSKGRKEGCSIWWSSLAFNLLPLLLPLFIHEIKIEDTLNALPYSLILLFPLSGILLAARALFHQACGR
jgi:hypothetical protein